MIYCLINENRTDGGVFAAKGTGSRSVDLPRHDQKAAVCSVVCAGGQCEQPVAGLYRDAGIVAPVLFDKREVLRKLLRVGAGAVVIAEGVRALSGDFRFDRGHDLIRMGGVERVKLHDRVRSAKCRILVGDQGAEHAAVFHVVPVDEDVVRRAHIAVFGDIQRAAVRPLAVEVHVQVFFRCAGCVHDYVVQVCAVDSQPADRFGIFGSERLHLRNGGCARRVMFGGEGIGDCAVTAVTVPVPAEHANADQESDDADDADHDENGFFHTSLLIRKWAVSDDAAHFNCMRVKIRRRGACSSCGCSRSQRRSPRRSLPAQ